MAYLSLEAELHDAFWAAEESPELEWMDALLARQGGTGLEIGSGSGRLLLPLLEKGHDLEGLEPSPDMLRLCREQARARHLEPRLHQGEMNSFSPARTYASLVIPAFTLQLSNDPAGALRRLHGWLEPEGMLYLSVFIPFAEINGETPENEWYLDRELELGDSRKAIVHTRHTIDRDGQILQREHRYQLHESGAVCEHLSRQTLRWFDPVQLHRLLTDAGFEPELAVADFDEDLAVDDDAQILTVVART